MASQTQLAPPPFSRTSPVPLAYPTADSAVSESMRSDVTSFQSCYRQLEERERVIAAVPQVPWPTHRVRIKSSPYRHRQRVHVSRMASTGAIAIGPPIGYGCLCALPGAHRDGLAWVQTGQLLYTVSTALDVCHLLPQPGWAKLLISGTNSLAN